MTFPRADKLVFILIASFKAFPSVPVFDNFQLPAKSITVNLPLFASPEEKSFDIKVTMNSIGDLEEIEFICVKPTDLF